MVIRDPNPFFVYMSCFAALCFIYVALCAHVKTHIRVLNLVVAAIQIFNAIRWGGYI